MPPTNRDTKSALNNCKKFDIDLAKGQIMEEKILDMFQDKKIEVKSEIGRWQETGNICIEFSSWGKPSGIASTEADFWFHNLVKDDEILCTLVFPVDKLRNLLKNTKPRVVRGGDGNASELYLLKLSTLFNKLDLFEEKGEDNE